MGGNFRLQNGLNLLCRVCPSGQPPKRRMLWSQLAALSDFQKLTSDFGNCDFLENRKNSVSSKMSTFLMFFGVVRLAVHTHIKNLFKNWLTKTHSFQNEVLRFLPQKLFVTK